MNQTIVSVLRCPICGSAMQMDAQERTCRCTGARTHCYDRAKSGYLNLTSPKDGEGDLKDAVRARKLFLEAGYYQPLSDAVNTLLDFCNASTVVDAGCGEGYYTNRMANGRAVLGVDLSRAGIDYAARSAKQTGKDTVFAVGSLYTLPVQDASVDAVTNLFAPCAEQEFSRVLKAGGSLLLVGAGERHLFGLKQILYDDPYLNPGRADLPASMTLAQQKRLTYSITVRGREHIDALFSMTPYYWRTSPVGQKRLAALEELQTEVDFDIYLFQNDGKEKDR